MSRHPCQWSAIMSLVRVVGFGKIVEKETWWCAGEGGGRLALVGLIRLRVDIAPAPLWPAGWGEGTRVPPFVCQYMTSCCRPSQPSRRVDNATARCDKKLDIKNSSNTRPSPPSRPSSETVYSLFLAKSCTGDHKKERGLLCYDFQVVFVWWWRRGVEQERNPVQCNATAHTALCPPHRFAFFSDSLHLLHVLYRPTIPLNYLNEKYFHCR